MRLASGIFHLAGLRSIVVVLAWSLVVAPIAGQSSPAPDADDEADKLVLSIFREAMLRIELLNAEAELERVRAEVYAEQPLLGRMQRALDRMDARSYRREMLEPRAERYFEVQGDDERDRRRDYRELVRLVARSMLLDVLDDRDAAEAFAVSIGDDRVRHILKDSIEKESPELAGEYDLDDLGQFAVAFGLFLERNTPKWEAEVERLQARAGFPDELVELAALEAEKKTRGQLFAGYMRAKTPERLFEVTRRVGRLHVLCERLHERNAAALAALEADTDEAAGEPDGADPEDSGDRRPAVAAATDPPVTTDQSSLIGESSDRSPRPMAGTTASNVGDGPSDERDAGPRLTLIIVTAAAAVGTALLIGRRLVRGS